jgi:hypothetical protein
MSREDGMRYCYQTATFYLFMPGPQERSARILKVPGVGQQIAFSEKAQDLYHALWSCPR